MPESKPTGPQDGGGTVQGRLSDKAPPKPRRRGSTIPAALVASTTALKIPPAPRPPRPTSTRARSVAASEGRPDRATERPVFADVAEAPKRHGGPAQRYGALALLAAVGVLGGAGWYLTQRPAELPEAASVKRPEIASNVTAAEDREPNSEATAVVDLDQEELSKNDADGAQPKPEPKAIDARVEAPSTWQAEPSGTSLATATSEAESSGELVVAQPSALRKTEAGPGAQPGEAASAGTTTTEDPTATDALVAETEPTAAPQPALPPFDAQAAKIALTAKASQASSCRKGDDPRGTAEVLITFAPSGRVTSANVAGQPFGGTATGGCVASTLRGASVPPFSGAHVTVRKLVKIH